MDCCRRVCRLSPLNHLTYSQLPRSLISSTVAMDVLEPLDPEYVRERLSKPPFVLIAGVENVRDLGSYPTKYPGMVTKPNLLYRSAEVATITEEGKSSRLTR